MNKLPRSYYRRYRCRQGGEVLRKRREQCITKACLDYLRVMENAKEIVWAQRMNSGGVRASSKEGRDYFVRLCRPGTADIYARLNNGHTVWIENKKLGEDLSDEQRAFKARMELIGDTYVVIGSLDELRIVMDRIFIKQAQI